MKISKIKSNPDNPRIIKDDKFHKLVESIDKFPKMMELRPIVIDNNDMVLGGNMRLKALQHLGFKDVSETWIKRADDLTDEEKKEFIIKDNAGFGEWDWDILANEWDVDFLKDCGLDIPDDWTPEIEATEDDFEIPEEIQTDIVEGDIIEIGNHRLMCGDSTQIDQVEKLMNGEKADMVFTDPPYSITTQGGGSLQKHFTKTAERIKDIVDFKPQEWLQTLPLYFNGNMNTFIFCNKDLIPDYLNYAKENNYNFNILVWCKKQVVPFTGGHHYSDIEYMTIPYSSIPR